MRQYVHSGHVGKIISNKLGDPFYPSIYAWQITPTNNWCWMALPLDKYIFSSHKLPYSCLAGCCCCFRWSMAVSLNLPWGCHPGANDDFPARQALDGWEGRSGGPALWFIVAEHVGRRWLNCLQFRSKPAGQSLDGWPETWESGEGWWQNGFLFG